MVYKKYIKKDGKLYGPYIYESKRVDGKVVSEYHGSKRNFDFRKFAWISAAAVLILLLAYFLISFDFSGLTGKAILSTDVNYTENQLIRGNVNILLKQGELMPLSSKLILENSGQIYEYGLDSLVPNEPASGSFYIDGVSLSGEGEGYGIEGEKQVYPELSFVLLIYPSSGENETPTETENISQAENAGINDSAAEITSNESINIPENNMSEENRTILNESIISEANASAETIDNETAETPNQTPDENINDISALETIGSGNINPETTEIISNENDDIPEQIPDENAAEAETSIITGFFMKIYNFFLALTPTGKAIYEPYEITGKASSGSPFVYNLSEGEGVQLKPGSVSVSGSYVADENIRISASAGQVIAETSYSEMEKGFGKDYIGNATETLNINLSALGLVLNEGELVIKIANEDNEIISLKTLIVQGMNSSVSGNVSNSTIVNATIEQQNESLNSTSIFPGLQIITAETASLVLTEEEKNLLAQEFGAESNVATSERGIFNGMLFVRHELGKEWIEYPYDPNMTADALEYQISLDRMKWLKDLAYRLKARQLGQEQNIISSENFSIDQNNGT